MFSKQLNGHHSYIFGSDRIKHIGKVGVVSIPPIQRIGLANPNVSQSGVSAVRSLERPKK